MAKEKLTKRLNISKHELIGLLCAIAVVLLCLGDIEKPGVGNWVLRLLGSDKGTISVESHITWTSVVAFILVGFLYVRKILSFFNDNFVGKFISIVVNTSMLAFLLALIGDAVSDFVSSPAKHIALFGVSVFCITMLLFGQRGLAKVAVFLSSIVLLIFPLLELSAALGFKGYFIVILSFSSLYFQENINFKELSEELKVLYGKTSKSVKESLSQAADETEAVGKVVKNIAVDAAIAANPAAGMALKSMIDKDSASQAELEQAPKVNELND